MVTERTKTRKSLSEVLQAVRDATSQLQESDTRVADAILQTIGREIFLRWHTSFIAKSQGGADEFGETWPELSEERIKHKIRKGVNTELNPERRESQIVASLVQGGMKKKQAIEKARTIIWGPRTTAGSVPINIFSRTIELALDPEDPNKFQVRRMRGNVMEFGVQGAISPETGTEYVEKVNADRPFLPKAKDAKIWVRDAFATSRKTLVELIKEKL